MNDRRFPPQRTGFMTRAEGYDFTPFDALLEETPGVDTFCSSSAWSESARRAFMPRAPLVVYTHGEAMAVFAQESMPDGQKMLLPLDATWTLGCPIASTNPQRDVDQLIERIVEDDDHFDFVMLSGMRPATALHRMTYNAIVQRNLQTVNFKPADRCIATIFGGFEPWFGRRSTKFRATIRRAMRDVDDANIRFEILDPATIERGLMQTLHDVELRSWKGLSGTGIVERGMATFCENLLAATAPKGQTRAILAYEGETCVGFIFGAVSQSRYRGVQMSVDHRFRPIGLGNILQCKMIEALAREDVLSYDLGSSMPYKTRWADVRDRTVSLLVGPLRRPY